MVIKNISANKQEQIKQLELTLIEEQAKNEKSDESSDENSDSNDDDNVVDVDYEEVEEEK